MSFSNTISTINNNPVEITSTRKAPEMGAKQKSCVAMITTATTDDQGASAYRGDQTNRTFVQIR